MPTHPNVKIIIIVQLIIISLIALHIYTKKNHHQISITPINKSDIQQTETDDLKYFFDLEPNQISTWSASFLKKPITTVYNHDGLNDTKNYSIEKEPGTFRILTLGDSYTFGHFVNTKNNWTEILENKLNEKPICRNIKNFEVINLGAPGYDLTYEVARYKKTGQKYNPDLVIWMLVEFGRINEKKIPLTEMCNQNKINKTIDQNTNCWTRLFQRSLVHPGLQWRSWM